MDQLFAQFCKEKEFLNGCSPRTIKFYKFCYMSWTRLVGSMATKQNSNQYIIALRESGISIFTINSYIRGLNSFFTWLAENEHCEAVKMKPLKAPKTVVKTFTNEQIKRLLAFKPRTFHQHRLYAMLCLAIDTGCRIDELLTVKRANVDPENLLITVKGKGSKERTIPISLECRNELHP
jgi:integrase/recombinase XerD